MKFETNRMGKIKDQENLTTKLTTETIKGIKIKNNISD